MGDEDDDANQEEQDDAEQNGSQEAAQVGIEHGNRANVFDADGDHSRSRDLELVSSISGHSKTETVKTAEQPRPIEGNENSPAELHEKSSESPEDVEEFTAGDVLSAIKSDEDREKTEAQNGGANAA